MMRHVSILSSVIVLGVTVQPSFAQEPPNQMQDLEAQAKELLANQSPGQKKLTEARELVKVGKYDDATAAYLWLWDNILQIDRTMVGVRGSFMAGDMKTLAEIHQPAKVAFTKLRDRLDGELSDRELDDWIVLNEIVGEEDRTLAWYDRVKQDPNAKQKIERVAFRLEPLLINRGRWTDLGLLYPAPIDHLERMIELHNHARETRAKIPLVLEKQTQLIAERAERNEYAELYAGLLAAGREELALKYIKRLEEHDPSHMQKVACAEMSLRAGVVRPVHIEWVRAAVPTVEEADILLPQLEAALKAGGAGGHQGDVKQ